MRLLSVALVVFALSPALAKAVPVFNVSSVNCSGTLTSSFASVVSLGCAGNLSLDGGLLGGVLSANQQVILTADTISLANLYMTAPVVTMSAINWITLGTGTTINATNQLSMNAGTNVFMNAGTGPYTLAAPAAGSITLAAPTAGMSVVSAGWQPNLSLPPFNTPLSILSPVPEPSIFATMLAGLLALAGLAMVNRKQFSSHFA